MALTEPSTRTAVEAEKQPHRAVTHSDSVLHRYPLFLDDWLVHYRREDLVGETTST